MTELIIGNADGPTTIYLAGSIGDFFDILAYAILILFYIIYFIKQFSLKRHGIHTMQLGHKEDKHIKRIEILTLISTICVIPVQIISIRYDCGLMHTYTKITGIILGLLGDLIFFISVLTMKNSWRAGIPEHDKTELITNGIYRYSRNPAFLAFDFMYIGILLMYFNLFLLVFSIWPIVMLNLQILQEEKFLTNTFGEEYILYKKHTYRYIGRKK